MGVRLVFNGLAVKHSHHCFFSEASLRRSSHAAGVGKALGSDSGDEDLKDAGGWDEAIPRDLQLGARSLLGCYYPPKSCLALRGFKHLNNLK